MAYIDLELLTDQKILVNMRNHAHQKKEVMIECQI